VRLSDADEEARGNAESQDAIDKGSHDFEMHQGDEELTESKVASASQLILLRLEVGF